MMMTQTENTPPRHMTLPNGSTARVDFEGKNGLLSAVFETGVTNDVQIGQTVDVKNLEETFTFTVHNKCPARAGHTAVIAVPHSTRTAELA